MFDSYIPGSIVGGYQIHELIGTGSCGQVYLVSEKTLSEKFVLKRIMLRDMDNEKILQTRQEVFFMSIFVQIVFLDGSFETI
jgi:hypothetical protein